MMEITVTHRGNAHPLSLLPGDTLALLHTRLEELTSVPPPNQKLLYKGKKPSAQEDATLAQAGLKSGMKVQMLGSTSEELGDMRNAELEREKKEKILRERAAKPQAKLRSTGSSSTAHIKYRFHKIEPLSHLPEPADARALLTRLSNDPAIQHIMQQHQFSVGLLTELAPHEQPHLLGLNMNAGQAIKLRIRTNAYDGFRPYSDIRRVLCHELTHNVWGDHDNNFKELNSKLNREVVEFERAIAAGAHHLASADMYEPGLDLEAEAHTHMLGEGTYVLGGESNLLGDSREERRRRALEATMRRLRKQEEEVEQSCGTAGPAATSSETPAAPL